MKKRHGVTLIEILVTLTVVSMVLASVLGVFQAIMRQWNGQVSRSRATQDANLAMDLMVKEIGVSLKYKDFATDGKTDYFELPADKDAQGNYTRVLTAGQFIYRGGVKYRFYLSDTTGSASASGNILWRAVRGSSQTYTPDSKWSLLPGSNPARGRIENVSNLSFVNIGSDYLVRVKLTVTAREGKKTFSHTVQRDVYCQNHN